MKSARHPFRLRQDRRGVAAVEFALVTTLLLIMFGGIADYGIALRSKSILANAVAQGAEYAFLNAATVTSSGLRAVVQSNSSLSGVTATITGPACYCISGTPPALASATCGSTTCSDGTPAGTYVIISATYPYTPFMPGFSGMMSTTTITEAATVRIQ